MATGALIAGTVISAAGSISSGDAQKQAAQQNAALARMEAEENARRAKRDTDALRGRQRLATAFQGTTSEGSPLLIYEDTAREADIEVRHILAGGSMRAQAYIDAGNAAQTAGYFDAASTILGGAYTALRT